MSLVTRLKTTVKEARETEDMRATIDKQQAQLEYVAVMADVDIMMLDESSEGMNGSNMGEDDMEGMEVIDNE